MSNGENSSNHRGKDYWGKIGIFKRCYGSMASVSNNAGVNKYTKRKTRKSYRSQEKELIRQELAISYLKKRWLVMNIEEIEKNLSHYKRILQSLKKIRL